MNNIYIIYSTFSDRAEALSTARILLERRLVACANLMDNLTSLYHWEGKVCESKEVAVIFKTSASKRQSAIDEIKRLHSYQVPCIVAYPVTDGLPAFLQWVADETA